MDLNSTWADQHTARTESGLLCVCVLCVCVADSRVIYCIVGAVMKCLTEREEVTVVGTILQNEELHDIGHLLL